MNLGALIDEMHAIRERKRAIDEQLKIIEREIGDKEVEILAMLKSEGLNKASGRKATVSVSELMRPQVEDWDQFYKYIRRHNLFHLLEKRPAVSGCREMFELKGKIPGVIPITLQRLNLRTIDEK